METYKDVLYVHVMIYKIKRTCHHVVIYYKLCYMASITKSIHYRTLLIFQNKNNNRFEGQNMGGIKDMLSPPCQNMGGIHHPHPPGFTPLMAMAIAMAMRMAHGNARIHKYEKNSWPPPPQILGALLVRVGNPESRYFM